MGKRAAVRPPRTHTDTHDSYSNALPTEWDGGLQATGMSLPIPSAWRPSPPARGAVGPGLAVRPSQASAAQARPGANKDASRGRRLILHGAKPRPHDLPAWGCRAAPPGLSTGAVLGVGRHAALQAHTGLAGQSPTRTHPGEHPVAVGGCSPSSRGPRPHSSHAVPCWLPAPSHKATLRPGALQPLLPVHVGPAGRAGGRALWGPRAEPARPRCARPLVPGGGRPAAVSSSVHCAREGGPCLRRGAAR